MTHPLFALSVAVVIGLALALFHWPRRGLLARGRRARRMSDRVYREDALKHIHKAELFRLIVLPRSRGFDARHCSYSL